MFKLFFTHLTTAITEIELYFARVMTVRDIPVDLKSFQRLVDVARNMEKAVAKSSKKSKVAKGKKKASVQEDSDNDSDAYNDLGPKGTTATLLEMFNIDENGFLQDYNKMYRNLGIKKPYDREYRVNAHLGVRLLAMSGLEWNTETKSKYRDQAHIAIAAALEYRIIKNYRSELLLGCRFARKMRAAIKEYMASVAAVHEKRSSSRVGETVGIKEWSFPDNISTEGDEDDDADAPCDAEFLRKTLDNTLAAKAQRKKDPIASIVTQLLNNPLLHSSQPGVPNGSVEIVAYQFVMALSQVRFYYYCDQI